MMRAGLAIVILLLFLPFTGCDRRVSPKDEAQVLAALAEGRLQDAMASVEVLRREAPHDPTPPRLLGSMLVYQRQNDAGVQRLLEAYELDPAAFPHAVDLLFFMSLARSGSFARDEARLLDFVSRHERIVPGDPSLPELRVVAASELLNARDCPDKERPRRREDLSRLLAELRLDANASATSWYHRAEAELLLGRFDDAATSMSRGLDAPLHKRRIDGRDFIHDSEMWDRLTMELTLSFLEHGRGQPEAARALGRRYVEDWEAWKAVHHGKLLPSFEYLVLASRVRQAQDFELPYDYDEMLSAVTRQGVLEQFGSAELRTRLRALDLALKRGDDEKALPWISDLTTLLLRDLGCISENVVLRPHLLALLHVARGDILTRRAGGGATPEAHEAYEAARRLLPEDPWLRGKP
jgi:tetratricopeptide (TPR) repeat protein